jgi:hypothetical protein
VQWSPSVDLCGEISTDEQERPRRIRHDLAGGTDLADLVLVPSLMTRHFVITRPSVNYVRLVRSEDGLYW